MHVLPTDQKARGSNPLGCTTERDPVKDGVVRLASLLGDERRDPTGSRAAEPFVGVHGAEQADPQPTGHRAEASPVVARTIS